MTRVRSLPGERNTEVNTVRTHAARTTSAAKTEAGSESNVHESLPVAPDPRGLAHLLSDLHCPGHWFLVFKNSPHEICHTGYISPKGRSSAGLQS